jgi:hypothetical protein
MIRCLAAILLALAAEPSTQPFDQRFTVNVDEKTQVEFLGVSRNPPTEKSWINLAGEDIAPPPFADENPPQSDVPSDFLLLVRVTKPNETLCDETILRSNGCMTSSVSYPHDDGISSEVSMLVFSMDPKQADGTASARVRFAPEVWATIATHDRPGEEAAVQTKELGTVKFGRDEREPSLLSVHFDTTDKATVRLVGVNEAGEEIRPIRTNGRHHNGKSQMGFEFEEPGDVKSLRLQVRRFTKIVEVNDISLFDFKTEPKIEVKPID